MSRLRLLALAGLLLGATGCFLAPPDGDFQGSWIGSFGGTGAGPAFGTVSETQYMLRLDFSLVVEDQVSVDAWLAATEPGSVGDGLAIHGQALGRVDGPDVRAAVPIRLLDGTTEELSVRFDRFDRDEDRLDVRVEWRGQAQQVPLIHPIASRWDLDDLRGDEG